MKYFIYLLKFNQSVSSSINPYQSNKNNEIIGHYLLSVNIISEFIEFLKIFSIVLQTYLQHQKRPDMLIGTSLFVRE